jgi:hypothetical protein
MAVDPGDLGDKELPLHADRLPSESVVIDIGGTIGALVVNTTQDLDGAEIEICPVGTTSRTHTIVRAREVPGAAVVYAGVFPALPAGAYTLLPWGTLPGAVLRVEGGAVTEFRW